MSSNLVIMPFRASKIWAKRSGAGPIPAAAADTGPPFVINRKYAECFGGARVILGARYGFIAKRQRKGRRGS